MRYVEEFGEHPILPGFVNYCFFLTYVVYGKKELTNKKKFTRQSWMEPYIIPKPRANSYGHTCQLKGKNSHMNSLDFYRFETACANPLT